MCPTLEAADRIYRESRVPGEEAGGFVCQEDFPEAGDAVATLNMDEPLLDVYGVPVDLTR